MDIRMDDEFYGSYRGVDLVSIFKDLENRYDGGEELGTEEEE